MTQRHVQHVPAGGVVEGGIEFDAAAVELGCVFDVAVTQAQAGAAEKATRLEHQGVTGDRRGQGVWGVINIEVRVVAAQIRGHDAGVGVFAVGATRHVEMFGFLCAAGTYQKVLT